MRTEIVHIGASELTYEIREYHAGGGKIDRTWAWKVTLENIGDPGGQG